MHWWVQIKEISMFGTISIQISKEIDKDHDESYDGLVMTQ